MKKLRAFWNLYKCRSFHLVTVEDKTTNTETVINTNMSQNEFDKVMENISVIIVTKHIQRICTNKAKNV